MNWNKQLFSGIALLALLFLLSGCGGFSGSKSVSPSSFFLPGFGKTDGAPAPAGVPVPTSTDSNGLFAAH